MHAQAKSEAASHVLDNRLLHQSVAALQSRLGLSHDRTGTDEQEQEMSLRDGVRPEVRVGSSENLRERQEGRERTVR